MIPFLSSIILCIHHPSFFQCGPFKILSVQYKRKVLYEGDKLWRLTWQEDIFHNPSPPICILDGKIHHLQCNQETDNPSNKLHFLCHYICQKASQNNPESQWIKHFFVIKYFRLHIFLGWCILQQDRETYLNKSSNKVAKLPLHPIFSSIISCSCSQSEIIPCATIRHILS